MAGKSRKSPVQGDGSEEIRRAIEDAPVVSGPPATYCPVKPLGHRAGMLYMLSPRGELRQASAHDIGKREFLLVLFGEEADWLVATFPAKKPDPKTGGRQFDVHAVADYLIEGCARRGLFDDETRVRGVGTWRDFCGEIIVHVGDAVLMDGRWYPAGHMDNRALYAAAPPIERPADEPADTSVGGRLLDLVRLWTFADPLGPELVVGFIGAALYGGAPDWRVHMLVSGEHGDGKTWLASTVHAALGDGAVGINDTTEAGLRQTFTGQARAFMIDEAEETSGGAVQRVVELFRRASSGEGARSLRGSAGGRASHFTITGPAYMTAILPPVLKPQDRSRIVHLQLRTLPSGVRGAANADLVLEETKALAEASPALRRRAIDMWPSFRDSVHVYRYALRDAGADARDADRMATLLAGRDMLMSDEPVSEAVADEEARRFAAFVEVETDRSGESEGRECLDHLLTVPLDAWRSGERDSVGVLVSKALRAHGDEARRALLRFGVRVEVLDYVATGITIANRHAGLAKLFEGTRWAGGAWQTALRYLEDAHSRGPDKYLGTTTRGVFVPVDHLPSDEDC